MWEDQGLNRNHFVVTEKLRIKTINYSMHHLWSCIIH